MFGIGWTEFIVIAFVLLIFVGPRHLPGVLRKVGLVISELKNASRELRTQVTEEVRDLERAVGSVKSPQAFMEDLGKELTEEVGSPYDEIYKAEAAVKEEVSSIKASIEETSSPKSRDASPDAVDPASPSSSTPSPTSPDKEAAS